MMMCAREIAGPSSLVEDDAKNGEKKNLKIKKKTHLERK